MKANTVNAAKAAFSKGWWKYALAGTAIYFFLMKDARLNIHIGLPERAVAVASTASPEAAGNTREAGNQRMAVSLFGQSGPSVVPEREEGLAEVSENQKQAFLKRFSRVALAEQQKFKVPASLILATALLQSSAGESELARQSHNFFRLPCGAHWQGDCREYQGGHFRRYGTAWESFRDFSLHASGRFPELEGRNYKAWAVALQETDLGGGGNFAARLVGIIDSHGLAVLDE